MPRTAKTAPKKDAPQKAPAKRHATQQSVDQAVKSICDIMRRGNCAGVMQYVPELTCVLLQHPLGEFRHRVDREVPRLVLRLAKAKAAETAAQAGVPGGGEIGEVIPHHPVVSIQRHAHLFGRKPQRRRVGLECRRVAAAYHSAEILRNVETFEDQARDRTGLVGDDPHPPASGAKCLQGLDDTGIEDSTVQTVRSVMHALARQHRIPQVRTLG